MKYLIPFSKINELFHRTWSEIADDTEERGLRKLANKFRHHADEFGINKPYTRGKMPMSRRVEQENTYIELAYGGYENTPKFSKVGIRDLKKIKDNFFILYIKEGSGDTIDSSQEKETVDLEQGQEIPSPEHEEKITSPEPEEKITRIFCFIEEKEDSLGNGTKKMSFDVSDRNEMVLPRTKKDANILLEEFKKLGVNLDIEPRSISYEYVGFDE